jgi:Uma2 family endonuclease
MKLEHGREPDLIFVKQDHLARLKNTFLDGPADVVIEITSPESIERDRGAKFVEYEAGGVPEYWLIDPQRRWAEFYRLGEQGCYTSAFAGQSGVYRSTELAGFWLCVEWLWQDPLPDATRITWTILGTDELRRLLAELEGATS